MAESFVPSLVVANGKARVGTLIQIMQDDEWVKGKVSMIDFEGKRLEVALDSGENVSVEPHEVVRQNPQGPAPEGVKPSQPVKEEHQTPACTKCEGTGERRGSFLGIGKGKPCKVCDGSGHTA
eukprot:GGOE01024352.1.p1 GENE.GGOE01024352.1~~GGOE01024352.1.p1  ORF type:complete len:136 (+),score=45.06 GGOE01024352.1:42-410(+)